MGLDVVLIDLLARASSRHSGQVASLLLQWVDCWAIITRAEPSIKPSKFAIYNERSSRP